MILNAILYRLGGKGGGPWYFNTKMRDVGCALVTCFGMFWIYGVTTWWAHALGFAALFACLCTYWDSFFGYDNFFFHGFMCGVAFAPYAMSGDVTWLGVLIRAGALGLFMWAWCGFFKNDVVEETGRGASLAMTLPIL